MRTTSGKAFVPASDPASVLRMVSMFIARPCHSLGMKSSLTARAKAFACAGDCRHSRNTVLPRKVVLPVYRLSKRAAGHPPRQRSQSGLYRSARVQGRVEGDYGGILR